MLEAPRIGGHADVATGRGVLSLRSFVGKALALFLSKSLALAFFNAEGA